MSDPAFQPLMPVAWDEINPIIVFILMILMVAHINPDFRIHPFFVRNIRFSVKKLDHRWKPDPTFLE